MVEGGRRTALKPAALDLLYLVRRYGMEKYSRSVKMRAVQPVERW